MPARLPAPFSIVGSPDLADHSLDPDEQFLQRLRRASASVLGDSDVGRRVRELCDDHEAVRRSLTQQRTAGSLVIAVIGAAGQGKSWVLRQFVRDRQVAVQIPSGNNLNEATEQLIWVGAQPPSDLDPRQERYVFCADHQLHSLGMPYVLVDTPGATDDRRQVAEIAKRALSMAGVLVLVTRRDQMRSSIVSSLALAAEGAIILPVVNSIRTHDDALTADCESLLGRIRQIAPTSEVMPPVLIDDYSIQDRQEAVVATDAIGEITGRLQAQFAYKGGPETRQTARLAAQETAFRNSLKQLLGDRLPALTAAVERLRQAAEALPAEIAENLIGGGPQLRAAVRGRLRAGLMSDTDGIWFPFRTLLSLLNLTSGAWDRVLLSLTGSLPSLIGAAWSSAKNATATSRGEQDIREGLKRRAAAIVSDRLGPLATRFRHELLRLHAGQGTAGGPAPADGAIASEQVIRGSTDELPADLAGIDALQEESVQIFAEEVARVALSRRVATVAALLGTVLFWGLLSGPIVALYRSYGAACWHALQSLSGDLTAFPRPDLAMMLTSLLLSLLPTAIFAMVVVSLAQSRRRVDQAEDAIRHQHHATIQRLKHNRVLRLRWDDPLLADAEFLLSVEAVPNRTGGGPLPPTPQTNEIDSPAKG